MTEEDLKNIEAPDKAQKAPLTETQKRRNAFWLQMLGALVLLIAGFILVDAKTGAPVHIVRFRVMSANNHANIRRRVN